MVEAITNRRSIWGTLLLLAIVQTEAQAELPPGSYDKLRAEAQEAITAKVLSVKTTELKVGETEVVAVLEVTAVERSTAGLKKGDELTVKYVHLDTRKLPGFAGPRPVPILVKGKTYPAYLNKPDEGETYDPAAYGASFSKGD